MKVLFSSGPAALLSDVSKSFPDGGTAAIH